MRPPCSLLMLLIMIALAGTGCHDRGPANDDDAPAAAPDVTAAPTWTHAEFSAALTAFLGRVVATDGLVHYDRIIGTERETLRHLAQHVGTLPAPSDDAARLAFLCNAYNVHVLDRVVDAHRAAEFTTVNAVDGFFDAQRVTVHGTPMTLNALENEHIRPFGDPRIHGALVCAARSCPPLRAEAFRAADLDAQLDDQCARWINEGDRFRGVKKAVGCSMILQWYAEDFAPAPLDFVRLHVEITSPVGRRLLAPDGSARMADPPIEWLPYDWTLNAAPPTS